MSGSPNLESLTLERDGVMVMRRLITAELAARIDQRLRANLARLSALFPGYRWDARKNVFSIAMAMADEADETLLPRMRDALASGVFQNSAFVAAEERARLEREIGEPILARSPGYVLGPIEHQYARYERARLHSAFGSYFIHQDAGLGLPADGLTAWIALTPCGRWSPALQFVPRKFSGAVDRRPGELQIAPERFARGDFARPIYRPGDAVIFDAWTVHGTYVHRLMPMIRTSLDIRLVPSRP